MRFVLAALALVGLLAACSSKPCTTDVDCGPTEVCVESRFPGKPAQKRCEATCVSDSDCILAGRIGKSCRPLADASMGPASTDARSFSGSGPGQQDPTSRGTLRICRDSAEALKR